MTLKRLDASIETLSKLDLSGLVTSMALGIAEAQKQLDDNSIAQTLILANPDLGINGVSLLELGFTPSFYQFQYVDISASMSLKVSSDFEAEASISLAINNTGDRSKVKNKEIIKQGEDSEYRQEWESSNSLVVKSSSDKSFLIGEQQKVVSIDKSKGAYKRRHKLSEDIRSVQEVDRVTFDTYAATESVTNHVDADVVVRYIEGRISFALKPKLANEDLAIFKVGEFDSTTKVSINANMADDFIVGMDVDSTLEAIAMQVDKVAGGKTQAFVGNQYKDIAGAATITTEEIEVFFEFNSFSVKASTEDGYNNQPSLDVFKTIALILEQDPNAKIKVVGRTDKVDDEKTYNQILSENRGNAVKNAILDYISDVNFDKSRIVVVGVSEKQALGPVAPTASDRYVSVEFINADTYYVIDDGALDAVPANAKVEVANASGLNDYVYLKATPVASPYDVDATLTDVDNGTITLQGSLADISVNSIENSTFHGALVSAGYVGLEIHNGVCYMLNEKTKYKYTALSKSKDKIKIKVSGEESSENELSSVESEEYAYGESQNENSYSRRRAKELKSNSNWNLDASLDARIASRFSFSIEGNSSMSARMVALPAPEAFLALVAADSNPNP